VTPAIAEAINGVGVGMSARRGDADILLQGRVAAGEISTDAFGFVYARCQLEFDVADRRRGVSIGTVRWSAREGRTSETDAVRACCQELIRLIAEGGSGQPRLQEQVAAWLNNSSP
jgi:hypothetical protein